MTEVYLGPPYHRTPGHNVPPTRLVIHATCPPDKPGTDASKAGEARSTARYFQDPNSGGSAHHVVDVAEAVRCAEDDMICWHAPPNAHSIGYEICGLTSYTRAQWLSPEVWPAVAACAALVRRDALHYGIPLVKLTPADLLAGKTGICGHVDVSQAWHQSDHTDPGPGFPWDRFMAELHGSPAQEEDIVATLDELRQVIKEELAAAVKQMHSEHVLLLHGDTSHGNSIDSIAKQVGVPQA